MSIILYIKANKKNLFYNFENSRRCNSLNKSSLWYVGLAESTRGLPGVFRVILISSSMSEIVTT